MSLFFVFPISGPNNGVKIISTHIKNALALDNEIEIKTIDTAQAKDYGNFGKFSFKKISFLFKILKNVLKVKNKDRVYLNFTPKGFAFYRDFIILLVCHFRTSNVTIHIHANGLEHKIKFYNKWLFLRTKIIVINEVQLKSVEKFGLNCYLLPNALPDYYKSIPLRFNKSNEVHFIFLSNLSKEKGIYRIQKLAELIKSQEIKCKLNIYGGTLSEKDETLINILNKSYEFLTYYGPLLNEKDKFEAIQQNDALLFLSDENYEVSPLVYIEALMSGLTIFTTKQNISDKLRNDNVAKVLTCNLDNFVSLLDDFSRNKKNSKAIIRNSYLKKYKFADYIKELKKITLHG
ncbi:glycosyltransferase [Winogradskyella endarachnes]|uniref:Glycosyltransferase n=1 Tax=Winogradskyella endarachnes TaxID=2681965 RepID=A0A6L6UA56_9FLAO|nr:glycosyltransferase [Winogradskyella endarachnes]MUU79058.1 glycosyltransferase [Winogradskyella endarachnes]